MILSVLMIGCEKRNQMLVLVVVESFQDGNFPGEVFAVWRIQSLDGIQSVLFL